MAIIARKPSYMIATPTFTILLSILRPPHLLPFAVASVQAQECQDFELFIICDGAPQETVVKANELAKADERIRVFAHPKGERNGERYRHLALDHARGTLVCHIADDDLWFPNHLTEIALLLHDADFGHLPNIEILPDRRVVMIPGHLSDPEIRRRLMTEPIGFFGLSTAGYRLDAYRKLAEGWTPAPSSSASDQHMWRKFLGAPGIRCQSRAAVTAVKFASLYRRDWPIERRAEEIAAWARNLDSSGARESLAQAAWASIMSLPLLHTIHSRDQKVQLEAIQLQHINHGSQLNAAPEEFSSGSPQSSRLAAAAVEHDELSTALLREQERAATLLAEIHRIRATWSWRLTTPFRALFKSIV